MNPRTRRFQLASSEGGCFVVHPRFNWAPSLILRKIHLCLCWSGKAHVRKTVVGKVHLGKFRSWKTHSALKLLLIFIPWLQTSLVWYCETNLNNLSIRLVCLFFIFWACIAMLRHPWVPLWGIACHYPSDLMFQTVRETSVYKQSVLESHKWNRVISRLLFVVHRIYDKKVMLKPEITNPTFGQIDSLKRKVFQRC